MKKKNLRYHQSLLLDLIKRLFKSQLFLKNFFGLMGILTFLFLIFAIVLFSQSKNIIKQEFTASSRYRVEETALSVDNHLIDIRYVIASLDTNNMIQAFFSYKDPAILYNNFYSQIQQILKAYVHGFPFVDSIYMYAECSDMIITNTERTSSGYFSDNNWMRYLSGKTDTSDNLYISDDAEDFQLFFRAKNDAYPYVLSIMKQYDVRGKQAAIIINLNLGKISQLKELNTDPHQKIYLISDDSLILFRNHQRAVTEPVSLIPELSHFQENTDSLTVLTDTVSNPYTYTQFHSSQYPWSYVMVTYLQEYTSRLSTSNALFVGLTAALFSVVFLLAFLFSMRSAKPIHNLLKLISEPQQVLSSELYNDREIRNIAEQIVYYVQQNQILTDELSSRLNLLNQTKLLALQAQINPHFLFNTLNMIHILESESLGYGHKVPGITLNLSRLLRYAIESTDLVPLETELKFTRMYTDILKERYDSCLNVIYDITNEALHTQVPKLFIQPIVENAVFHGLAENMDENSTVTISCHREALTCVVSVKDNGVGMSQETLQLLRAELNENAPLKNSIGLKNVATRMNLLYGDAFEMKIDSVEGEGSIFILRFPG